MNSRIWKDIIEWDVQNGGLSLYYALKDAKVICFDLEWLIREAHELQ